MTPVEIRRAREAYVAGELQERLARHHRHVDAVFYGWNDVWLDPAYVDWDLRGLLAGIECPLLLIQGDHDQYGTISQLDAIGRPRPGRPACTSTAATRRRSSGQATRLMRSRGMSAGCEPRG